MSRTPFDLGRRSLLQAGAAAAVAGMPFASARAAAPALELVASFKGQVTGVAVSPKGRIFVNFPRWEEDVAVSLAEVGRNGALTPYPNAAWNAYRDAKPGVTPSLAAQQFVCVQSVTVDPLGNLWVLDPAAPGLAFEVPGGPKLVRIDLAINKISRVYAFDDTVAPQGSYLNDIRFTPDGQRAVMTNSGQPGCLIAFDVASGQARRVLDGHPSTQFQPNVAVVVNGHDLRRGDGAPPQFSADGLALDTKGEYAYWQATTGTTMYRVPVAALFDAQMTPEQLAAKVELYVQTFVADGYWMARNGVLHLTSCGDNAVKRMQADRSFVTEVRDSRLLWPDSMAEGADGSIYVTASHIPQMKAWQGPGVRQTQLFRFRPAAV